jgi:WD40 repeat protein
MEAKSVFKKLLSFAAYTIAFLFVFLVLAVAGFLAIESWFVASHGGRVNAVAFSPDGRTVASGSADGTVLFSYGGQPAVPGCANCGGTSNG